MNDRIRIGDRVRVYGQTGRVVDVLCQPSRYYQDPRGEYRVRLDGSGIPISTRDAVKIEEPAPAAAIGAKVRITETWNSSLASSNVGVVGTLRETRVIGGRVRYTVDPEGRPGGWPSGKYGAAVEKVADPTPEPEIPVEIPMKNMQAATFAHQLLGTSADLDKLIGVAEFVMDRRTLGTETTGTVGIPEMRTITVPPAVEASFEDLVITDSDGDKLTVGHYGYGLTIAKVYVRSASDDTQRAVYLTEADVDAVIARLQAFKAQGFTH